MQIYDNSQVYPQGSGMKALGFIRGKNLRLCAGNIENSQPLAIINK